MYRIFSTKIIILSLLLSLLACGNNQQQSEQLNDLLKQLEEKAEKGADTSTINRTVSVYTDSVRVQEFKDGFYPAYSEHQTEQYQNRSVAQHYIAGEEWAKEELLDILYAVDHDDKFLNLLGLDPYDQPNFRITDKDLIAAIKHNLYEEEYEATAIDLLVAHAIPNLEEVLLQRLLSGESYQPGKLLVKLAKFQSQEALNYTIQKIRNRSVEPNNMYEIVIGFKEYMDKGSASQKEQVLASCFYILKHDMIPVAEFEELQEEYAYLNPAAEILQLIFNHAIDHPSWIEESSHGASLKKLAKAYEFSPVLSKSATAVLIMLEGKKYRRNVIEKLKLKASFNEGIALAGVYYKKEGDERILRAVMTNFNKLYGSEIYSNSYTANQVFDLFSGFEEIETERMIRQYMGGDVRKQEMLKLFRIHQQSFDQMAQDLHEKGLTEKILEKGEVDEMDWALDRIYDLLAASGAYFWLDSEEYEVYNNQDAFFKAYQNHAQGVLDDMILFIDQDSTDEMNHMVFKATLNKKGYEMNVGQKEGWDYSLREDFQYFINFILEENQIEKQFLHADYDSYIFTTPETRDQLIEDYALEW